MRTVFGNAMQQTYMRIVAHCCLIAGFGLFTMSCADADADRDQPARNIPGLNRAQERKFETVLETLLQC